MNDVNNEIHCKLLCKDENNSLFVQFFVVFFFFFFFFFFLYKSDLSFYIAKSFKAIIIFFIKNKLLKQLHTQTSRTFLTKLHMCAAKTQNSLRICAV